MPAALLGLAGVGLLAPLSVWSSALFRGARDLPGSTAAAGNPRWGA